MNETKALLILHFNDVYELSPRKQEPVGGAARFATRIREFQASNPLVLFSGDDVTRHSSASCCSLLLINALCVLAGVSCIYMPGWRPLLEASP